MKPPDMDLSVSRVLLVGIVLQEIQATITPHGDPCHPPDIFLASMEQSASHKVLG